MRRLITKVMLGTTGQWAIFYVLGLGVSKLAIHKYFKTREIAERWAKRLENSAEHPRIFPKKKPLSELGNLLDSVK